MRHTTTRACASAALLLALAARASAAHAQDAETLAHQRFLHGMQLYDARDFASSLYEFRESYALFASPNSRLYIARALRDLERLPEAAAEYDTTIAESEERARTDPRYLSTRDAARDELGAIEGRIGRLQLVVPNAPRWIHVRINGRVTPPGELGMALPVAPGDVLVQIDADGFAPEERTIPVGVAQRAELEVQLRSTAPPPDENDTGAENPVAVAAPHEERPRPVLDGEWFLRSRSPLRVATWASLGVGVAGFVAFGTFALWANAQYQTLHAQCGGPCPASERDAVDTGRALQTATNVSLAVGVVGLVAGATLAVVGPRVERPRAATAPPAASPAVALDIGPGALTIRGVF